MHKKKSKMIQDRLRKSKVYIQTHCHDKNSDEIKIYPKIQPIVKKTCQRTSNDFKNQGKIYRLLFLTPKLRSHCNTSKSYTYVCIYNIYVFRYR